jgi:hypothetical protein
LKSSDLIPSVKYLIEYHGVFEWQIIQLM